MICCQQDLDQEVDAGKNVSGICGKTKAEHVLAFVASLMPIENICLFNVGKIVVIGTIHKQHSQNWQCFSSIKSIYNNCWY